METPTSNIFCLKGGYNNRSLIQFDVCKKTNLVRILHFAEYDKTRYSYAEQYFVMTVDNRECRIESKMHYSLEFARKVWTIFANLPGRGSNTNSAYSFHKYVPYTLVEEKEIQTSQYALKA